VKEELQKLAKKLEDKATIAGGCFRSLREGNEPNDIDIFCISKSTFDATIKIVQEFTGLERIDTNHSVEFGKYTIIKCFRNKGRKLYGKPTDLVHLFDINITKLYMTPDGEIVTTEDEDIDELYKDIDNRSFDVYAFNRHEARTMTRINKYISYGYTLKQTIKKDLHYSFFEVVDGELEFDSGSASGSYL